MRLALALPQDEQPPAYSVSLREPTPFVGGPAAVDVHAAASNQTGRLALGRCDLRHSKELAQPQPVLRNDELA